MAPSSKQSSSTQSSLLRHRVLTHLTRLSDRDTHSLALHELELIIPTLTPQTFPLFITSLLSSTTTPRPSARAATLHLLSLLASTHGPSLSPHLPKLTTALIRRLRDPDSTVRLACTSAAASLSTHIAVSPSLLAAVIRPLTDALATEQDPPAQSAAAACLAAAVDAAGPGTDPGRTVRAAGVMAKAVRLMKCDGFRAKAAVLGLVRSVVRVCGVGGGEVLLRDLVAGMVGLLRSEEWAARKAAAEGLEEVAVVERGAAVLSELKDGCLKTFEARRFDKVKAVREAMNAMLEAWKEVPDVYDNGESPPPPPPRSQASSTKETPVDGRSLIASDGRYPTGSARSHVSTLAADTTTRSTRKRITATPLRRTSPTDGALKTTARTKPPTLCGGGGGGDSRRRSGPPASRKLAFSCKSAAESTGSPAVGGRRRRASTVAPVWEEISAAEEEEGEIERSTTLGVREQEEEEERKVENEDDGYRQTAAGNDKDTAGQCKHHHRHKECEDFSSIRKQLVQIESQQSSLMELLQKFIGTSQNGMHSLEARVHGLEMALDDMSYDLAVSTARMAKSETPKQQSSFSSSCCLLPGGSDFLTPKFWRRSEPRYSSAAATRFSLPSNTNNTTNNNASSLANTISNSSAAYNPSASTFKFENRKRFSRHMGSSGFIINPLAETHRHNNNYFRGGASSEISSSTGVSRSGVVQSAAA